METRFWVEKLLRTCFIKDGYWQQSQCSPIRSSLLQVNPVVGATVIFVTTQSGQSWAVAPSGFWRHIS